MADQEQPEVTVRADDSRARKAMASLGARPCQWCDQTEGDCFDNPCPSRQSAQEALRVLLGGMGLARPAGDPLRPSHLRKDR